MTIVLPCSTGVEPSPNWLRIRFWPSIFCQRSVPFMS
jgi:hypothetical protein